MPEEPGKSLFGFNVSDLLGFGKGMEKLMSALGLGGGRLVDGVSRVAEAKWLAKTDAENEAHRIRVIGAAQTDVIRDRARAIAGVVREEHHRLQSLSIAGGEVSAEVAGLSPQVQALHERGVTRMAYENVMQQLHRDTVTAYAAAELAEEEQVSEEPVDPDWMTRLFRTAQDISNEDMQLMFGRILAGEVKQPGTFSPRTVDFLATLTKEEALAFQQLCAFIWHNAENPVLVLFGSDAGDYQGTIDPPAYATLQHLNDIGLIDFKPVGGAMQSYRFDTKVLALSYHGSVIVIESRPSETKPFIPVGTVLLTRIGKELARVCQPPKNPCMVEYAVANWTQNGCIASCPLPEHIEKPPALAKPYAVPTTK